jgi:hypothetical protein
MTPEQAKAIFGHSSADLFAEPIAERAADEAFSLGFDKATADKLYRAIVDGVVEQVRITIEEFGK